MKGTSIIKALVSIYSIIPRCTLKNTITKAKCFDGIRIKKVDLLQEIFGNIPLYIVAVFIESFIIHCYLATI